MKIITTLLIGLILGVIDVLPMIKKKLSIYECLSAFSFHLIMPTILYLLKVEGSKIVIGGLLYIICTIPLAILATKEDKKIIPIMLSTSCIIGLISGFFLDFLLFK